MTVIIDRSDFGGNKDSEGKEYFDYILSSLNIDGTLQPPINSIELTVENFIVFPERKKATDFEKRIQKQNRLTGGG